MLAQIGQHVCCRLSTRAWHVELTANAPFHLSCCALKCLPGGRTHAVTTEVSP